MGRGRWQENRGDSSVQLLLNKPHHMGRIRRVYHRSIEEVSLREHRNVSEKEMMLFNAIFAFSLDRVKIKPLQFITGDKAHRSIGQKSDSEEDKFVNSGMLSSTSSKEEELEGPFLPSAKP